MDGTLHRNPPHGWLRLLLRVPIVLYRLRLGWLLGRRFVLLQHRGRRSGKLHATVLEVVRYDAHSGHCVIASGWGERSQWYRNVMKDPRIRYTIGVRERAGRAKRLNRDDALGELRSYAKRHPRAIRELSRMMTGEAYTGGRQQLQRLAGGVPVLLLTPAPLQPN